MPRQYSPEFSAAYSPALPSPADSAVQLAQDVLRGMPLPASDIFVVFHPDIGPQDFKTSWTHSPVRNRRRVDLAPHDNRPASMSLQ